MLRYKIFTGMLSTKTMLCCLLLCSTLLAAAQNDAALQNLQQRFNNYQQQAPQEKIFVHTDKDFLLAGEILWFKVYAVNAYTNTPTGLSKVAYVEVLDADKKAVLQAKIKLDNGSGNGSFQLPTSVKSGNYTVRAYTAWMKNFSADLYFTKPVTIVNSFRGLDVKQNADSIKTVQYDIRLFPEGGNLVSGIQSKVAFRIIDQFGRGANSEGKIVDQSGNAVTSFRPAQFGIGSFTLTPVAGNTYTAVVTIGNQTIKQALPQVYGQGYVMHLDDAGNQVNISVNSTSSFSPVFMLVNTGRDIKKAEVKTLQNGKTTFAIDKAQLGDGITHFTIFNDQQKPVCERLYFKRPAGKLAINVQADQQAYTTRKKGAITISAGDESGAPQMADMSVAVYRLDSLQGLPQQDIMTYLLLNADLKGTIESPAYYFTNTGAAVDEALDNLMLTHGWSRYKWDDILQNKTTLDYVPEFEGHIVTGRITDKRTGQPAPGVIAYLSVPGKSFKLAAAKSNSNGVLRFNMKDFVGGNEVILQTDQVTDSSYRIDISNPFSEKAGTASDGSFAISGKMQNLLVQHSINTQVQNAYLAEKTQQFFTDIDTMPFYGQANKAYMLDDYVRFNTMEEVLREYVAEVAPRRQRGSWLVKVVDDPRSAYFEDNALVMVDGVPFFNMDTVLAFNPLKMRRLEVVTHKYLYGPLTLSGIVSYTTYKGDLDGVQLDPASLVLEYDGLQLQREFYTPKYDNPTAISSRLPDFRDVLYWSPVIKTGATGKTQASFYTSDLPGTYAIIVQGLTANGKMGSGMHTITVK